MTSNNYTLSLGPGPLKKVILFCFISLNLSHLLQSQNSWKRRLNQRAANTVQHVTIWKLGSDWLADCQNIRLIVC